MKNENLNLIEDVTDNEVVGYKIDDLVEAFTERNDEQFVRRCLEEYFNLIYGLGYASGKNFGVRLVKSMFDEKVKQ